MDDKAILIAQIHSAFSNTGFPGQGNITNSYESDESASLEHVFADKTDWRTLDPEFIDLAPNGFASALSFFSHDALQFYLPAYLIADLENKLDYANVVFHLYHGLDNVSGPVFINHIRYSEKTWLDYAMERFRNFTTQQAAAVVGYLEFKLCTADLVDFEKQSIRQALENYWSNRAADA